MKEVGKQFRVSYRSVQTILTKRLSQLPVEALFWGSKMVPAAARVGQLFQKGENDPSLSEHGVLKASAEQLVGSQTHQIKTTHWQKLNKTETKGYKWCTGDNNRRSNIKEENVELTNWDSWFLLHPQVQWRRLYKHSESNWEAKWCVKAMIREQTRLHTGSTVSRLWSGITDCGDNKKSKYAFG